jgi:hypothetical protein
MVAYSFQKRFTDPIRQGYKRQTIRRQSFKRHARVGELIQLYTAMRTSRCARILPDVVCTDVCPVLIRFDDAMRITRIETAGIPVIDLDGFAIRDGFTDLEDMGAFWEHTNGPMTHFEGVLIEWAMPRETDLMGVAA